MLIIKNTLSYIILSYVTLSASNTYFVDNININGTGTLSSPFNNINLAFQVSQPGDTILVLPGTFQLTATINTVRDGKKNNEIVLRAYESENPPLLEYSGTIMEIKNNWIIVDGFVFNAKFANADVLKIRTGGDNIIIRNCEIKNATKDGIDISKSDNIIIDNCEIHHLLAGSFSDQKDAHGIVASGQRNLIIRNCNIYFVSGDCFQTDPGRGTPLWDNVLIEHSKMWTGPLPEDNAAWKQGEIPGENAVDTKINEDSVATDYHPAITLKNVEAYGFVEGYISNRAAFNIKEKVNCRISETRVYNNEIAFRLRGPGSRGGAEVTIVNCIAFNNKNTFRIEDGIENLSIFNCTFDKNNDQEYINTVSGGYDQSTFMLKNCLFMHQKPVDASEESNLSATQNYFVDSDNHDFHLAVNSPAINKGIYIDEVTIDYEGNERSDGKFDVGAYEFITTTSSFNRIDVNIDRFHLRQNYPNPFNSTTKIGFSIPNTGKSEEMKLVIYNTNGKKVKTLFSGILSAGYHEFFWDGTNSHDRHVASDIYFYSLITGSFLVSKKMIFLR